MAQFEVFANPSRASKRRVPYLLDVQHDLLDGLATRVVVPLVPPDVLSGHAIDRLTPKLTVKGRALLMLTPEVAGVPRGALGKKVADLEAHRAEIIGALDLLLAGV